MQQIIHHLLINDVAEIIKVGEKIEVGRPYSNIFKNSTAQFLRVDPGNIEDYFGGAIRYYNNADFPAVQLVWADRNEKFPWEKDFEEVFIYKQPLLDRNVDFKFREKKNLAVFTTRQWLDLKKPILHVVHDKEGDWQFLTGDQMPDDIRIVLLGQMILKDGTLNDVFNLDYGQAAERSSIGDNWTRSEVQDDD